MMTLLVKLSTILLEEQATLCPVCQPPAQPPWKSTGIYVRVVCQESAPTGRNLGAEAERE